MIKSPHTSEDINALYELVESHTRSLFQILERPHTIEEVEQEVETLNDLIYSFTRTNELLEKLLDNSTSDSKRAQVLKTLKAARMELAEKREYWIQLREKSNGLIKRTAALIAKAQMHIDKEAHRHSGYTLEVCGLCKGLAGDVDNCSVCNSRGTVLVHQPAAKCARCSGNGRTSSKDKAIHYSSLCVVCEGTGWVRAEND